MRGNDDVTSCISKISYSLPILTHKNHSSLKITHGQRIKNIYHRTVTNFQLKSKNYQVESWIETSL